MGVLAVLAVAGFAVATRLPGVPPPSETSRGEPQLSAGSAGR